MKNLFTLIYLEAYYAEMCSHRWFTWGYGWTRQEWWDFMVEDGFISVR